MLDREKRLELIQRTLGLKHKLKVHDSMKLSETHEDISEMTLARWDLEDELRAIERILEEDREAHIVAKRAHVNESYKLKGTTKEERTTALKHKPTSTKKKS